jgi:hypothetical protein
VKVPVAVLMPYGGPVDQWRAQAFGYVLGWYAKHHPEWPIHVGRSDPATWSKGAAVADAFTRSDADVLVVADADSIVAPEALCGAVAAAKVHGWAMPHRFVYRLSTVATSEVYEGRPPSTEMELDRPLYRGVKAGGIVCLRHDVYETVGGIDPRFEGWGGEDRSLEIALNTLVCRIPYGHGDLFHLWHPHPAPDLRGSPASEALVMRYREAHGDRAAIRALIEEFRCLI